MCNDTILISRLRVGYRIKAGARATQQQWHACAKHLQQSGEQGLMSTLE